MTAVDYLTLLALVCIWVLMGVNIFLTIGGFLYYYKMSKTDGHVPLTEYPFVSVLVPAHNESVVIQRTVHALLQFDYPKDKYEIIVINDNSSDDTTQTLQALQRQYPDRKLMVVSTDNVVGGQGKSNALNIGFSLARGSVFAIYDADNTPERPALRILVENLMADPSLGAVIGKFRTRNKNANILTRFVNLETLTHQCMSQAGRWFYFKLCTIPGTNFVMRREIIEAIGGWDPKALSEDTEISFRIYRMGYKIRLIPQAVTWEQEPFRLNIWFRQRTRWAVGNVYVLAKQFRYVFDKSAGPMRLDVIYYTLIYVLMLAALVLSDAIFILGILGFANMSLGGLSPMLWVMASVLFVLNVMIAVSTEVNEFNAESALLAVLMLFTYSKLWVLVMLNAFYLTIKRAFTQKEIKWYKTERSSD